MKRLEDSEPSLAFDRRLDAVLRLLLEASPEEHPEILRRECGGDPDLEVEARSLLSVALEEEAQETSTRFKPVLNLDRGFGPPPEKLGAYRLLGEIGRGGMGVVYLAERDDGSYAHRVAIKLLDDLSGRQSKRRFLAERQILAELDHPGIVRILDGGVTDEGRPFFVMDFVEGASIERYAEQEDLGLAERVELVLELCDAVESAHRALVVHRDIKPSNVLVDSDRRVRLLDFGIAKSLEGSSLETQTGQHAMTPQYAPPEQYQGKTITVASDVYQLGLLTYELIARQRPYDLSKSTPAESVRLVCEERPEPPSTVRVEDAEPLDISPDLDLILMKALHKEPERRYLTVERLADDLRRYLNREPVAARPDSSGYRLRLFFVRNAAVASLTAVAFIVGLAGAAWSIRSLALERQATELQAIRATLERDRAEETVAFLVNVLAKADPFFSPDADISVREALRRGAIELESDWEGSTHDRARLLEVVALVETRLGMHSESVGHARQALDHIQATTVEGGRGPDSEAVVRTALVLATALRKDLRSAESLAVLKDVVAAENVSSGELPADLRADYLANLAEAFFGESDVEAAEEAFRESIQVSSTDRHGAEFALVGLGNLLMVRGRPQEAIPYMEQALKRRSARLGPDHVTLHELHGSLGNVLVEVGRSNEAVEHHRRALALLEMRLSEDHQTRVGTLSNLGIALNASV